MEEAKLQTRPPIVTILGHVDHGKTTLLDAIRKTNVAGKEAGGITQSIGASVVTLKDGKKITFIDTPGHAAFSQMRSRGAQVADVAVLVVDASDGVKPQTKEALTLIKEAKVTFIVAITKIDLPAANVEGVLGELEKEEVLFEGRGGNTPYLGISAKTGQGVPELLEMISLVSEVAEIKADPKATLEAVVIETAKEKSGLLVSVVVRNGTLRVGETLFTDKSECKIRGLFDYQGTSVKEILPGEPAQILGFSVSPSVGSIITSDKNLVTVVGTTFKVRDEYKKIKEDEFPVILKAKSTGALEAVQNLLPPKVMVVDASVGEVLESDVLMAKSTGAWIFAFETGVAGTVLKLAEAEKVRINKFDIVYELIDKMMEILKAGKKEVLGKAEIVASFPFDNKRIAGCKMTMGKITKVGNFILMRGEREIGAIKVLSLKRQKSEITQALAGEDFGILFEPQLDFGVGDVIVSVAK
jgi:translation initiation factor IF-2